MPTLDRSATVARIVTEDAATARVFQERSTGAPVSAWGSARAPEATA